MIELLPQNRIYYKANLHTHSVISDGKLTPEEVKQAYKERGYSVVALTDHDVIANHQHLCDRDFLFITGTEIDIEDTEVPYRTRHLCLLSRDPYSNWIPFRNPDALPHMVARFQDCQCEDMPRNYTPQDINAIIAKANEKGFLVTYNHPVWSQEGYPEYMSMEGLWAMEYRNTASLVSGYDENNSKVYQDMLRNNVHLCPVMADDMHMPIKKNGACQIGKSWVMVAAEELRYDKIMDALARGDMYASCGPQIHSVRYDGESLHISCSPAERVMVMSNTRAAAYQEAGDGALLEEVTLSLSFIKKRIRNDGFIRVIVTAADGTYAVTRAYRTEEFLV